jgi:hypothetical protein
MPFCAATKKTAQQSTRPNKHTINARSRPSVHHPGVFLGPALRTFRSSIEAACQGLIVKPNRNTITVHNYSKN